MRYKKNNNVEYFCRYQVIFCPKYRRSVLVEGVDIRLKELIEEKCEQMNAEIINLEIKPDCVLLLIEVSPQYGIHKTVKQLKSYSSKILREEFPWLKSRLPSLWTNAYLVTTIGSISEKEIKNFTEKQKNI